MDMVNPAPWGRCVFLGALGGGADPVRSNDAGVALGLSLPRAYPVRAERADRKWSPRQTLIFIAGISALSWAAIIWASIRYL